jgi:hypothetical protein
MIEPVTQNHPGNADFNIAHLGEVRQAQTTRLVDLRENDFPWRSIGRPGKLTTGSRLAASESGRRH